MKKGQSILYVLYFIILLFQAGSCSNRSAKNQPPQDKTKQDNPALSKPPSTYQDTLIIEKTAAVFYHPDSLQLAKIKKIVDSLVFDGSMHEYFYQMRNARMVINKSWPDIKIIETKNVRYLLFKKNNNETKCIDLDAKGDPYGLFLFDRKHDPELADMMNIDNELSRYFFNK